MEQELKKLKKQSKALFLRYKAKMGIDELNVINTSKELYKKLDEMNRETYLRVAKTAYKEQTGEDKKKINAKWVLAFLTAYDAITRYVYVNEIDRKQSRFIEAYLATRKKNLETQKAFRYWWQQTEQYAIEITDGAVLDAYADMGYTEVEWMTEEDDRVCEVCRSRDGKKYPIDNIPDKPHYNCRCWFKPVPTSRKK